MVDAATLIALIVTVAALLVAAGQFTLQLMATADKIRKCDGIVTGGVTKGALKRWHWQQFRFVVYYQAIVFALPPSVNTALGISPAIQLNGDKMPQELWDRAASLRSRRDHMQSCWISFAQDLIMYTRIPPRCMYVRLESGDRIPGDLHMAPIRVDAVTLILLGIAMGMQVDSFAPTKGEIILSGSFGSFTSFKHPALGTLLQYNVPASEILTGIEVARRHGRALYQDGGVWANAVFGRFKDRSYRQVFIKLDELRIRKLFVLKDSGWPERSSHDTIHGAACFMAFAHVDCYLTVPPSVMRPWCAHFAEIIVKAHHLQICAQDSIASKTLSLPYDFLHKREQLVERYGCSSPYIPWQSDFMTNRLQVDQLMSYVDAQNTLINEALVNDLKFCTGQPLRRAQQELATGPFLSPHATLASTESNTLSQAGDGLDPSSYTSIAASWEVILRADQCTAYIYRSKLGPHPHPAFRNCVDKIIATAISSLSDLGPPSWGKARVHTQLWPDIFSAACEKVLGEEPVPFDGKWASVYACFSILRAAYYTIMMRAAAATGPGLTENSKIDTALTYMA